MTPYETATAALKTATAAVEAMADETAALRDRVAELEAGQSPGADPSCPAQLEQAQITIRRQAATIDDLREQLANAPTEPSPAEGAEQAGTPLPSESLEEALERMADGEVTEGGVSLLVLGPGHHGPLRLTGAHGRLLTRRTLRIAGPAGSSIGAVALVASAGVTSFALELWGVALRGDVSVTSPGFRMRTVQGATIEAPRDAGPGVPL